MTTFTATNIRGVVFNPSSLSLMTYGPAQVSYRADFDYVSVVDPPTGLAIRTPTTELTLTMSGAGFTFMPTGPLGPLLNGGTITGFTEVDDQGRVVATATGLPPLDGAKDAGSLMDFIASGDDDVSGSSFSDELVGGAGNDFIRGLNGNDTVVGGLGNDDVNGNLGEDWVWGSSGNDTVRGGQGNDTVHGDDGDDGHVNGNLGDDLVFGGAGNDTVYGGQGNDRVYGDETIPGVAGNDLVSGDLGDDSLFGGPGADTLLGGDGNDLISGDAGNDLLWGGPGADRFAFAKGFGQDWVGDFRPEEGDRIVLPAGVAYTVGAYAGQVVIDLGGGDVIGLAGVPSTSFTSAWITFS